MGRVFVVVAICGLVGCASDRRLADLQQSAPLDAPSRAEYVVAEDAPWGAELAKPQQATKTSNVPPKAAAEGPDAMIAGFAQKVERGAKEVVPTRTVTHIAPTTLIAFPAAQMPCDP